MRNSICSPHHSPKVVRSGGINRYYRWSRQRPRKVDVAVSILAGLNTKTGTIVSTSLPREARKA